MEKMYGSYYTPQTVSNLTKVVNEQVTAFKCRTLAAHYAVIPLRRDTVAKEAVHIAIGIRPNGHKEVLAYKITPTESGVVWSEVLADLKQWGIQKNLLFVAAGLVGLDTAVGQYYPEAAIQQCLVHVSRNIAHHVRVRDREAVLDDFKLIHLSDNKLMAEHSLANFINCWHQRYPKITQGLLKNQKLLTCFDFPPAIRASIYSTNLIESFNKKFKRQTKKREQFPNEESLERTLMTVILDYNDRSDQRVHKGFGLVQDTLESKF